MKSALLKIRYKRRQTISDNPRLAPDVNLQTNQHLRDEFIDVKVYQGRAACVTHYDLLNVSVLPELHMAAYNNDTLAVRGLLTINEEVNESTAGCPKLIPDKNPDSVYTTYACFFEGTTPLMMAAYHGHVDVMRRLVKAGAEVNAQDCVGNTACTIAVSNHQKKACVYLQKCGADLTVTDQSGTTLLLLACSKNHYDLCLWLMKRGADVHVYDRHGRSCLHFAAWHSNHAMMTRFLGVGIDANIRDVQGRTPLHYAVGNDHFKLRTPFDLLKSQDRRYECGHSGVWKAVTFLLNRGADTNAQDEHLMTPTHLLAENLPKAVSANGVIFSRDNKGNELFLVNLALLLDFGARVELPDDQGRTVRSMLKEQHNVIAVRLCAHNTTQTQTDRARRCTDAKRTTSHYRHNDAQTIETNIRTTAQKLLSDPALK